jgi:hypothetical protein
LLHIDVFGDYLAMVGGSDSIALHADGYTPYIALTSVSIPDYFYWGKLFIDKVGTDFGGIQFSTDGELLIGHSAYGANRG